jgi:hypothetical protein
MNAVRVRMGVDFKDWHSSKAPLFGPSPGRLAAWDRYR